MPRRRPSTNAKSKFNSKPRPVNRKESRIKRWDKASDIELDEEDQFHASRDKILLDEGDGVDEDGEDEEEVFALRGLSDSGDEEDYDQGDYDGHDLDGDDGMDVDDEDTSPIPTKSKSKSKKSKKEKERSDSEEEEETWGRGKGAYYSSNAAQLDSDDEEANELEEKEALRLQAKAREAMADDDFGLGDAVDGEAEPADDLDPEESMKPPPKEIPRDKHSILRALEKECPESLALARDWDDTVRNLMQTKARVESMHESESDTFQLGLEHMYYQALLTYATTLAFYLNLRASEKYATRPHLLRQHPILKRLLTLKEGINTLENIGVGQDVDEDEDEDEDEAFNLLNLNLNGDASAEFDSHDDVDDDDDTTYDDIPDIWSLIKKKGLDPDELADLLDEAAQHPPLSHPQKKSNTKTTGTSKKESRSKSTEERPKKKRKTVPDQSTSTNTFDLVEPDYTPAGRKQKTKTPGVGVKHNHTPTATTTEIDIDPYGEVTALNHVDMSDKQARKKSLRFHVARIASSAERRSQARTNAVGGDDDIPYRERRKEREARLEREREKRIEKGQLGAGGDDLDDVDPEAIDAKDRKAKRKRVSEEDSGHDDNDDDGDAGGLDASGYYDLVKQAAASKKARKKAAYEAATARPDLDSEDVSGPRSITRAILKNKGLTPHRPKAVRNPRVKKRQKYEQAKKKVASQKAVFKGGIGDVSKYSGEQSGISKVVKSVRL